VGNHRQSGSKLKVELSSVSKSEQHRWQFAGRFRRNAFGWRSQPAIQRVREAVAEIKRVARRDPVLGAEGAVLFLKKVSAALEQVDSSSGAIGTAVNHAIEELVSLIAKAPVDLGVRAKWLDRLWDAYVADTMPYIETLGDFWGELCATKELASVWTDNLIEPLRATWRDRRTSSYFQGTLICLSSLLAAERYQELLDLLEIAPFVCWAYRQWGVRALAAMGKSAEALDYAEASRGLNDHPDIIARACEEILLSSGRAEEAYERYALAANRSGSYLTTYRAILRKYPHKDPERILRDLVARTPGDRGKWFAAAKEAGFLELAIELANEWPCDPKTLTRAARDFIETHPGFALGAGLAALYWLGKGYGYEITGADVWAAYSNTIKAAERLDRRDEVRDRVRAMVANKGFVAQVLGRELGLTTL
jgi:tetratricopeptide (TPR) repeat protein